MLKLGHGPDGSRTPVADWLGVEFVPLDRFASESPQGFGLQDGACRIASDEYNEFVLSESNHWRVKNGNRGEAVRVSL